MTIKELIKITGEQLEIGVDCNNHFFASIKHLELCQNGCLVSVCGRGKTIVEAINSYCKKISSEKVGIRFALSAERMRVDLLEITMGD